MSTRYFSKLRGKGIGITSARGGSYKQVMRYSCPVGWGGQRKSYGMGWMIGLAVAAAVRHLFYVNGCVATAWGEGGRGELCGISVCSIFLDTICISRRSSI